MHRILKAVSTAALVTGVTVLPQLAFADGATLTYPAAADLVSNVSTQFTGYFNAAIAFSMTAVAGFAAWRYMKKAGNKV